MFLLFVSSAKAETLKFSGILGNSGEQGTTLVRFPGKSATGLGVAYDPATGTLFDRAGETTLNRYAVDGRQIASYPLKEPATKQDTLAILNDELLLKLNKKLYTLPFDSPDQNAPTLLPTTLTALSSNSHENWLAAANGKDAFYLNRHGETRPLTTLDAPIDEIEIGPDGGIYATLKSKTRRIDPNAAADKIGPWESPGDRAQFLNGSWFGSSGHGTLRRFNTDFQPDPGVVLGGASGWFIGYVEGNHELDTGRGIAHLGGNLYAISGENGVLHLMEWHPVDQRFTLIRRIGAVPDCTDLALDSKGRVWFHTGVWNWTDNPDTPIHHSVPWATGGLKGIVIQENDSMTGPGIRWGKEVFYHGDLEGPAKLDDKIPPLPQNAAASTLIQWQKRPAILITDATGKGTVTYLAPDGKSQGKAADLELIANTPLKNLTSLASTSVDQIIAAADGQLIEFTRRENQFQETKRWNQWSDSAADHFGESIHLALHTDRLWITDTTRHRVLVFDQKTRKPIAQFGITDQPGNDLSHLKSPKIISANQQRAIFHDSENQRLVKLELIP